MKKQNFLLLILLVISVLFAVGCTDKTPDPVDYSEYPFTDTVWVRDAEHDTETIIFRADGSFTYYCGCGNPVNDSDLCEGYIYDNETQEIQLDCLEETDEMVTTIKIISVDEETLELDFDGETRTFVKEKE